MHWGIGINNVVHRVKIKNRTNFINGLFEMTINASAFEDEEKGICLVLNMFLAWDFTDSDGIMPKKMEEIAYQSTDKVYRKEDNGPYECLR